MNVETLEALEKAVICCIVTGDEGEVFSEVAERDFMFHGDLFGELKRYWQRIGVVDLTTVKILTGDVAEDLKSCLKTPVSGSDAFAYIRAMREGSAIIKAQKIALDIVSPDQDFEKMQDSVQQLTEVVSLNDLSRQMTMEEGLMRFMSLKSSPKSYIATGYGALDRRLFVDRGDYVVIGARPSVGKTAFALNLALNIAGKGYRTAFFSLETSRDKLMARLVTTACGLDFGNVQRQKLTNQEWVSVAEKSDELMKLPLTIVEASGITVSGIQAEAVRLGAEVVFIDYLGLIKASGNSRYEQMTNISIGLHTFAQRKKISVIALSQLTRVSSGKVPGMEDLRESGQIEQDADVVILMSRSEEDKEMVVFNVAKNKEGEIGAVLMKFEGRYQRFYEMSNRNT